MKFTITLATLLFSASTVLAGPVDVATRDVWVPKILEPTQKSVWHRGKTYHVKWDLNRKPKSVTNPIGMVLLAKHGRLNISA